MSENLTKLVGNAETKSAGEFVLNGMELAKPEGFGHVAKIWYNKTTSYEDGLAQIEAGRAQTEDIATTLREMTPTVHKNVFAMYHGPSGRHFVPTAHAVKQMGTWAGTGTWFVENMLENPTDIKGRVKYVRDGQDADTLARVFANGFRRVEADKKFLFRTRKDGTLRAMVSDIYAVVDNRWLVELLSKIVPGGRLSHWRGDSDTLYGNILIPDTIREDTDSDYGGMLSIGNSEIGERRVSSLPSIFRAICMNGCIWGATKGKGIRQVHRGKIDLNSLAMEIRTNLQAQIPLLPQGIDKLLASRGIAWDGKTISAKPIFASLAKDFKLSKKQATSVLAAWNVEKAQTPDLAYSLFGVTNAVTRAGQTLDNASWVDFDSIGGELISYTQADFAALVSRAKSFDTEEVEEMFSTAV